MPELLTTKGWFLSGTISIGGRPGKMPVTLDDQVLFNTKFSSGVR